MLIRDNRYAVTNVFVGFLWRNWPIGFDIDSDEWGIVVGKYYVGWLFRKD